MYYIRMLHRRFGIYLNCEGDDVFCKGNEGIEAYYPPTTYNQGKKIKTMPGIGGEVLSSWSDAPSDKENMQIVHEWHLSSWNKSIFGNNGTGLPWRGYFASNNALQNHTRYVNTESWSNDDNRVHGELKHQFKNGWFGYFYFSPIVGTDGTTRKFIRFVSPLAVQRRLLHGPAAAAVPITDASTAAKYAYVAADDADGPQSMWPSSAMKALPNWVTSYFRSERNWADGAGFKNFVGFGVPLDFIINANIDPVTNDYELLKRIAQGTLKKRIPTPHTFTSKEKAILGCYWGRGSCSQSPNYKNSNKWKEFKFPSWGTISQDCTSRVSIGRPDIDKDWHHNPPWHDLD